MAAWKGSIASFVVLAAVVAISTQGRADGFILPDVPEFGRVDIVYHDVEIDARDGVVTTRDREDGEVVAAAAPLLTVSRLDEVWMSIYVPEDRLGGVKLGQAAAVRIDGSDRRYPGKVTFVSPEAEFTPRNAQTPDERAKLVYRVKITLPNPDGVFKPGMPGDGYLEAGPPAAGAEGK